MVRGRGFKPVTPRGGAVVQIKRGRGEYRKEGEPYRGVRVIPLPASPGCQSLFLLRPWRYDTVGARIGDRLAEVLMLVPEKEADGTFLGHIPAEHFHRRLQVGVRESLDGFLQVCVGALQRFLQFFRLDDLCSAPVAPAPHPRR